jgi:CubicO group peptidase (beta-lactamase class C family)
VSKDSGLREVDRLADAFFADGSVPGIAYGVVIDGGLVHARGLGTVRIGEDAGPDADSVFRIASMTKSFTAAAVVLLRDEGRLRLDDPISRHVPELEDLHRPTTDSPPLTIRHLLTMSAGFPTDDPWGDRLQELPLDRFADLLRGGFSYAWPTGTAFEYSNLGYGILGRVITNVAGAEYRDIVRERILAPLAMDATVYSADEAPPERLARGYVRRDDAFVEEPFAGYGALASMGGLFSSVTDLARWVAGLCDAWPPRDDPEGNHPLSRASRREMQQVWRMIEPELTWNSTDAVPQLAAAGYGFGTFVRHDLLLGRVVAHSGGYPGFGSHMRWHPASGLGVIALGNATYAPMSRLASDALKALVLADAAPVRRVQPSAALLRARDDVKRLIDAWNGERAAQLFAENVDLDEPLVRRRDALDRVRERHGALTFDGDPQVDAPSAMSWWLAGEHGGRVKVETMLTPEPSPRVQAFDVTSVPEPSSALRALAEALTEGIAAGSVPANVHLADTADRPAFDRALLVASLVCGPCRMGPPVEGDGDVSATFRLHGDRRDLDLRIVVERGTGRLASVSCVPVPSRPPLA